MATEIQRITDQFHRAWNGDAWHGPPVAVILASIDARTAAWKPTPGTHSIRVLAAHIAVWLDTARRRLAGEDYQPGAADWFIEPAEKWPDTVQRLGRTWMALVSLIEKTPEARLAETMPGQSYTGYVLLHGVLQHSLYHAGQIAQLRRIASEQ